MLHKIVPKRIWDAIVNRLNMDKLYEIRLRSGGAVSLNYGGKYCYIGANGLTDDYAQAYVCGQDMLQDVVMRATDYSIYAATKQINDGYISVQGGIRLGISGYVVWDKHEIRAVKQYSAINIRIPHQVVDCCKNSFGYIYDGGAVYNTLLISPPGAGKTTYLRDVARLLGQVRPIVNVLLVDERSEIAACYNGQPQLQVGGNTDVISNCTKSFAFEQGIRAMRPDVIMTDEIANEQDIKSIRYAMTAGVKVIASIHAYDMQDLYNKVGLKAVLDSKVFDRYIVLSSQPQVGTVQQVLDSEGKPMQQCTNQ
jgi:stage III sporulation protein AA